MSKISSTRNNRKCDVKVTDYAIQDLEIIPDEVLDEVEVYLDKLSENLYLGQPLHDRKDLKLKGCRKIYIADRAYRIVYQVIKGSARVIEVGEVQSEVTNIAKVISVGLREGKVAYRNAHDRLALDKDDNLSTD